jgi:hypothetical protein
VEGILRGLRAEIASSPRDRLIEADHRALRDLLASSKAPRLLDYYRDRSIPLLEEAYRQDAGAGQEAYRAAWLLVLLRIDSPRSVPFLEKAAPSIAEPDLRRDVEAYLERQAKRRQVGRGAGPPRSRAAGSGVLGSEGGSPGLSEPDFIAAQTVLSANGTPLST